MKRRPATALAVLGALILGTACQGGRSSSTPPIAPVRASALCTVIYVGVREEDPESACVAEMVFADLRRRGYVVYRLRDDPWPEAQPSWDYIASTRVTEESAPGKREVELVLELSGRTRRTMATSKSLLDSRAPPSEDAVSRLVGPAVERLPASVPREEGGQRPCPDRGTIRASPEPDVSKACVRWGAEEPKTQSR